MTTFLVCVCVCFQALGFFHSSDGFAHLSRSLSESEHAQATRITTRDLMLQERGVRGVTGQEGWERWRERGVTARVEEGGLAHTETFKCTHTEAFWSLYMVNVGSRGGRRRKREKEKQSSHAHQRWSILKGLNVSIATIRNVIASEFVREKLVHRASFSDVRIYFRSHFW